MNNSKSFVERTTPFVESKGGLAKEREERLASRKIVSRLRSTVRLDRGGRRSQLSGELCLLVELHFRANVARRRDDFLQQSDLLFRRGVDPFGVRLRKAIEGDRARAGSLRQLVPQFLGEKRHERMQQPQRALKRREQDSSRWPPLSRGRRESNSGFTHSMYQSQKSPQKKW